MKPLNSILKLTLFGFLLRLAFLISSHHLYYPDELFQTLEQSHSLVQGYALVPWDFTHGLRSWFLPGLLSLPLIITKSLGIDQSIIYLNLIRILLAAFSSLLIPTSYYLTLIILKNFPQKPSKNSWSTFFGIHTPKQTIALATAFAISIWYELIYFSARALSEVIAVNFFASGILIWILASHNRFRYFLTGIFIGIATLIRPQYFPLTLVIVLWQNAHYFANKIQNNVSIKSFFRHQPLPLIHYFLGVCLAVIIFGLIDQVSYGHFLVHLFNNLRLSFASGISEIFGVKPPSFYLIALLSTSMGLVLLALPSLTQLRTRFLWISALGLLGLHLFFPHKEYRFIYTLIPIWIILCLQSIWIYAKTHAQPQQLVNAIVVIFSIVSILGIYHRLPYQPVIYPQPLIFQDPSLKIYTQLASDSTVCGVFDATRQWVYTGGYFHLNQQVPLYSLDYQPSDLQFVNTIISYSLELPTAEYAAISKFPGYNIYQNQQLIPIPPTILYKRVGECTTDSQYTYQRSFDFVEAILGSTTSQ